VKIAIVVGTRPEIIKMAPVIRELENKGESHFIIHTGQHYSYNLDSVFFEQLKLPQAKYNLNVGSGSHAEEMARILIGTEKVLSKEEPDIVLLEGDTNSVIGGALAAAKLHIEVGHVEAGLRSYDRQMPEEINRILTDHCSDYLFAPTSKAKEILLGEGIRDEKIFVTGNTIVDAVHQNLDIAREAGNLTKTLHLATRGYFLVTLHRQENVDSQSRFAPILDGLDKVFGLKPQNIKIIEPIDFFSFLELESNARLVLTDSGGVQEEACILRVPCVTLRDNTERPETIEVGANILAGASSDKIVDCVEIMLNRENNWINPFGDGKAGRRIVEIIKGTKHG
jgi:UDP-N-acetylglucosamine 2-epimerase (non-hydrolysing)